jgi:SAM-dependent methyltransferase
VTENPWHRWDERYGRPGWAYGTEPNGFLISVADRLPAGRALCLGGGEGRNAVFLAQRGFDVTAVDWSAVGLEKAQQLAVEHEVAIRTEVADLASFTIDSGAWDVIISIFCHLPPGTRAPVHRAAVAGLKPGGALVLEAYTPRQLGYGTGGPPTADLMMTLSELEGELAGIDFAIACETERSVGEGSCHTGRGAVVQILGFKPSAP